MSATTRTTKLGSNRHSSRNTQLRIFNVEYRGCLPLKEAFPQPGMMTPDNFTKMAEGIEKRITSLPKKQVKKASKLYRKAHLTFDCASAVINMVDVTDASVLASMPLLELLSFRVLRGQGNTLFTEALLFVKDGDKDSLVAERVVFASSGDISTFHHLLKTEFQRVADAAAKLKDKKISSGSDESDAGYAESIVASSDAASSSAMSDASQSNGADDDAVSVSTGKSSRRCYFFSNIDSEDGELIISDAPQESTMKQLASEGSSDVVGSDC
eukprot:m.178179 g.178179  ORF g.178179 m.178179 type:complete len:270 (-) comp14495_c0_seq1:217-1026(-)